MTRKCVHCGEVDPEGYRVVINHRLLDRPYSSVPTSGPLALRVVFCGACYKQVLAMSDAAASRPEMSLDAVVRKYLCFHREHDGFATVDCVHPDHVVAEVMES